MRITIDQANSTQEQVVFEYLIDVSKITLSKSRPVIPVEFLINLNQNSILMGVEIMIDQRGELTSPVDKSKSPIFEYGKNVALILKQFIFKLPFEVPVTYFTLPYP
jgi:hypothetical protein